MDEFAARRDPPEARVQAVVDKNGSVGCNGEVIEPRRFSIGAGNIREDIQYTLARAKKMAGTKEQSETIKKLDETQKGYDQEIQKLQEEMKKLEDTGKEKPKE